MDKTIIVSNAKKAPLKVIQLEEDVPLDLRVTNHHQNRHLVSIHQITLAIDAAPEGSMLRQHLVTVHEALCANPGSRIARGEEKEKAEARLKPRIQVLKLDTLDDTAPRFKYNPVPHPDEVRVVTDWTPDETDEERERRRRASWRDSSS